jgi:Fic family protein
MSRRGRRNVELIRATISVEEVMRLYKSPEDRARRVLANLVKDGVLRSIGNDT